MSRRAKVEWVVEDGKVVTYTGEKWTSRELLEKVKEHILAKPASYDQHDPGQEVECGTVACIAGWASMLVTGTLDAEFHDISAFLEGKTKEEWGFSWIWLFEADFSSTTLSYGGPKTYDLRSAYKSTDSLEERAQIGAAAIDLYIQQRGL